MEHVISSVEAPASRRRRHLRWLPFVAPGILLCLTVWFWRVHDKPLYDSPVDSDPWARRESYIIESSLMFFGVGVFLLVLWLRRKRPSRQLIWEVPYFAFGLGLANLCLSICLWLVIGRGHSLFVR